MSKSTTIVITIHVAIIRMIIKYLMIVVVLKNQQQQEQEQQHHLFVSVEGWSFASNIDRRRRRIIQSSLSKNNVLSSFRSIAFQSITPPTTKMYNTNHDNEFHTINRNYTTTTNNNSHNQQKDGEASIMIINSYINEVISSIQNNTFASMTLRGPASSKKKKIEKSMLFDNNCNNDNALRGHVRLVTGRLIQLQPQKSKKQQQQQQQKSKIMQHMKNNTKVQMTFKYHGATDIVKNWDIVNDDVQSGLQILFGTKVSSSLPNISYAPQNYNNKNKNIYKNPNDLVPTSEWVISSSIDEEKVKMPEKESIISRKQSNYYYYQQPDAGSKFGIQSATLTNIFGNILELDIRKKTSKTTLRWKQQSNNINNINNNHNNENKYNISSTTDDLNCNDIISQQQPIVLLNQHQQHDRIKNVPVSITEDFWVALGVLSKESGKPINVNMSSKLKQCQKFVEIVDKLIQQCINNHNNVKDHEKTTISIVDMGCGRGYLTFALHSFLQDKYNDNFSSQSFGVPLIQSRGIDIRPKLVKEMKMIVQSLGIKFNTSLHFETGTIESFLAEQQQQKQQQQQQQQKQQQQMLLEQRNNQPVNQNDIIRPLLEPVDVRNRTEEFQTHKEWCGATNIPNRTINVLIALHACDTATDDAMWSGITQQADVIVVAPCCHKQIRPQLNEYIKQCGSNHPLSDILRYNIYRERISETVTDSIRAMLLELAGYTVNVFEFIGGEHTSKNVMITGVRRLDNNQSTKKRTDEIKNKRENNIRDRIRSLASLHGIKYHKLAQWMNETIQSVETDNNSMDSDTVTTTSSISLLLSKSVTKRNHPKSKSPQTMPPLPYN